MDINNYIIESEIGSGSQGKVLLCKNTQDGRHYAIKRISKDTCNPRNVETEIEAGKRITPHKHIVEFYHAFEDESYHYLVFEQIRGVDLYTFLEERGFEAISEDQARSLVKQLVKALIHIHKCGFGHSDIKLENVMLDKESWKIKIIDFGLSHKEVTGLLDEINGCSLEYAAPELLDQYRMGFNPIKVNLEKFDVFSMGIVVYALLYSVFPFDMVERANTRKHSAFNLKMAPKRLSPQAEDLISKMLETYSSMRISLSNILEHPWMVNVVATNSSS